MTTKRHSTSSTSTKGLPWATYARLSKAMTGDIEKVEYQTKMCQDYAAARSLTVSPAHQFEDTSLSAWKKGVRRPQWDALMEAAQRGEVAGVIVYAVDRFTRRPKDLEALIELAETHGLIIEGPRSGRLDLTTATGRQQARWMAMQAASESDNTSERAKATLAKKMRDGQPMGAGRSFGFEIGGMIQRPAEVAIVREIAERMLAGEPLQSLAAEMNVRDLRTTRDGPWTGSNLGRMLGAGRYGGHVEHHGEHVGTIPGEPVLDAETYDAVQALLASRRRGRRPTGDFLLTGLLTCSDCQRTMNGARRWRSLKDGTRPRAYTCPRQRGGCGRAILAQQTEEIVGDHMIELLSDPEAVAKIVAQNDGLNEARSVRVAQLQAIEDRLTDLEVKWAAGELIQSAYNRAKPVLDAQRLKVLAGLEELSPAAAISAYDANVEWGALHDTEKREVIRQYGVRIEVLPHQGARRYDASRVTFPG